MNTYFNQEIILNKDPFILFRRVLSNKQQIIADAKGWRKVHMKQIKKDDPYRKQLYIHNPDGIYYVDEKGYYVSPEKWEEAERLLNNGSLSLTYESNYYDNLTAPITIERIYGLKLGGKIKKFQTGGITLKDYQTLEGMTSGELGTVPLLDPNRPMDDPYNIRQAIAQLKGWREVEIRYIDKNVNSKWLKQLLEAAAKYGPTAKYIIDPNTKEIIPESTWDSLLTDYGLLNTSGLISENQAAFDVQQEANRRAGLRHSAIIDLLGELPYYGALAFPGGWTFLASKEAIDEGLLAYNAAKNDQYGLATAHTVKGAAPFLFGPASKVVTPALQSAYQVVGKNAPKIIAGLLAGTAIGTADVMAQNKINKHDLSLVLEITPEYLINENFTLEEIHNELRRLGLNIEPYGTGEKTQWIIKGKEANKKNQVSWWSDSPEGRAAKRELAILGVLAGLYIPYKFTSILKYLGKFGKLIAEHPVETIGLAPHIINGIWYLGDKALGSANDPEVNKAMRAYNLILYLNNLAQSNPKFLYHALYPSTLSEEMKTGDIYEGFGTEPDSIATLDNGEQKQSTTNQSSNTDDNARWGDND